MSYRAVMGESPGRTHKIEPDAFLDGKGRIWFAKHAELLPRDPESYEKIPRQFWHPDARKHYENAEHEERKWEQDERMADKELRLI